MARVLLIAPTCDGTDVGEAWVAYQWATNLAAHHDVTVLTYHKRGRPSATSQLPGVRVVEWTEPALLGRAERLNSLLKPGYLIFYLRARRWIRRALAAGEQFDLAHQPVPVATRYPSPAAGAGLPLVLGPVGGGLTDPPGFAREDSTAPWYVRLRGLDRWRLRHDPLLRQTYASADVVLGIAPYVAEHLADVPLRSFVTMSETALEALPPPPERPTRGSERPGAAETVRLLHVGRLVRTKGVRDTLRALGEVADPRVHLDVVGDGPDRAACEALVARLGLGDRVTFHGALPRPAVDALYRAADVFVFPSWREPGGNVVFEAMGHGLPLVVADRGGPAGAVDDTCAIRVPVTSPRALAHGVAQAIELLVARPDLRAAMGAQARRRVGEVGLWSGKMTRVDAVYAQAVAAAQARPPARARARSASIRAALVRSPGQPGQPGDRTRISPAPTAGPRRADTSGIDAHRPQASVAAPGPGSAARPVAGVVIPAHNEERTIGRLLALLTSDPDVPLEIVVVCNGCTDATAQVARTYGPTIRVVETPVPSKAAALRRGDEVSTTLPRVYLDADIEISARSVALLVAAVDRLDDDNDLRPRVHAAGPARRVLRTGASWPVRWYLDVWEQLPQVRDGLFGRGVIALSATGHARLGVLPSMLSDDLVISETFTAAERVVVLDAVAVVRPPARLADLLRRRVRVATGNTQVDRAGLRSSDAVTTPETLVRIARSHPSMPAKVAVFAAVAVVARRRAAAAVDRGDFSTWQRDESSRQPSGTR